jgi:hypothetical protein
MKLKSNKDHHGGQNQAWKLARHILQVLLLKWHINFRRDWGNLEFILEVDMISMHLQ